jgi:hypothetical protein
MKGLYRKVIVMHHKVQRPTTFNALISFKLLYAAELTGEEKAEGISTT